MTSIKKTTLFPPINIKSAVIDILCEKYEVVDFIDMFDHDIYPESMAAVLKKYQVHMLRPYQRIVVLHHDTDFYHSFDTPGNNIYNFFSICAEYQVPLPNVIFLTNHYGIETEIKKCSMDLCGFGDVKVVYTSQWFDFPDATDYPESPNFEFDLTHTYTCLNGQQRAHRVLTLSMLSENGLLEDGIISYHFQ